MKRVVLLLIILFLSYQGFAIVGAFESFRMVEHTDYGKLESNKIRIDGDVELASFAAERGWDGDGSENDPFIIENLNITTTEGTATEFNASEIPGLEIKNTRSFLIINNCFFSIAGELGATGVKLSNVTGVTVRNSGITGNGQNGIEIWRSNGITIVNNSFSGNTEGILAMNVAGITIRNNLISSNFQAVRIGNMMDEVHNVPFAATVNHNLIDSNDGGIVISGFINATISSNVIRNCTKEAIDFSQNTVGTTVIIEGNIIEKNYQGINSGSWKSSDPSLKLQVIIRNNHFETNSHEDIFFGSDKVNGTIYLNNFMTPDIESQADCQWDNGTHGNYWGDYTGVDNNGNGIGDSAYKIDYSRQDNFPLMEQMPVSITIRGEVYTADSLKLNNANGFAFFAMITGFICIKSLKRGKGNSDNEKTF